MATDKSSIQCFVCDGQPRYHCPRCGVHYCSLSCYKDEKHQECSEDFYKEQVMDELKNMRGTPEDQRKMIKLLQQQHQQTSRDQDLEQRLAGIYLDDHESLWRNLTEHEKYIFEERLRTGNVDFLKLWKPWWQSNQRKKFPQLFKKMESCAALLKGKSPNGSVKYSIVEVLLTYLCLMRLYNGDLYDSPIEVVDFACKLSNVLSDDRSYSNIETVLIMMEQNFNEKIRLSDDLMNECVIDMKHFAEKNLPNVTAALCDFHDKLKKIRKILKENDLQPKLYKMVKKLYFLSIYANEHEEDVKTLCNYLLEIFKKRRKEILTFQEQQRDIEIHKNGLQPKTKHLIEEI